MTKNIVVLSKLFTTFECILLKNVGHIDITQRVTTLIDTESHQTCQKKNCPNNKSETEVMRFGSTVRAKATRAMSISLSLHGHKAFESQAYSPLIGVVINKHIINYQSDKLVV